MFLFINSKILRHTLTDNLIEQPYWTTLLDNLIVQPPYCTALLYNLIVQPYCTALLYSLIGQPYWTASLDSLNLISLNSLVTPHATNQDMLLFQKSSLWGH